MSLYFTLNKLNLKENISTSEKMKHLILLLLFVSTSANEDKTLGMSEANPASSCNEIYQHNPTSRGSTG